MSVACHYLLCYMLTLPLNHLPHLTATDDHPPVPDFPSAENEVLPQHLCRRPRLDGGGVDSGGEHQEAPANPRVQGDR